MSEKSSKKMRNQEVVKKRMENSSPLVISRWFSGLWKKKK
jgi:hypothetical protein